MGSFIEINQTLQITREQGFPAELDISKHLKNPYQTDDFKDKIFTFKNKKDIRFYLVPPINNFLVENIDGKWVYWGLCHIIETTHDYINHTTSGKFKIVHINSVEQMKNAYYSFCIDYKGKDNYFETRN